MNADDIAELRQRAQEALSRARLTTDPGLKAQWQALAKEYLAKLAELEGGNTKPPTTTRPRAVRRPKH